MPENDEEPVFIGGAGRSGTTLVVDMLGLHPRITPIYETDFVLLLTELLFDRNRDRNGASAPDAVASRIAQAMDEWTQTLPQRPHFKAPHERFHHGPHHVLFDRAFAMARTAELVQAVTTGRALEGARAFVRALFAEHCRRAGKPRWVNKTPAYVIHLPQLDRWFPTLRFLHCLRDGRDVVQSIVGRPFGPNDPAEAAAWWRDRVQAGLDFGRRHPERYLEVRYEDLIRTPGPALDRIFTWLGEEPRSADVLAAYRGSAIPLDAGRIGTWREAFSVEERQRFDALAGAMLRRLGYVD